MNETLKPFICDKEGCKMAFTNEDHLDVHKKRHDMALQLDSDAKNADQTPTPTRFIRNCEEVGLFQDLQNVNPFDETFRKAAELASAGILHEPEVLTSDSLHTPHDFPHMEQDNDDGKFRRYVSSESEFTITPIVFNVHSGDENGDSKDNIELDIEIFPLNEKRKVEKKRRLRCDSLNNCDLNSVISKDNLISNNSQNIVPDPIPSVTTEFLPLVVNNLCDIEIDLGNKIKNLAMVNNCSHEGSPNDKDKIQDDTHNIDYDYENSSRIIENVDVDLNNAQNVKTVRKRLLVKNPVENKLFVSNTVGNNKQSIINNQNKSLKLIKQTGNISSGMQRQREINRVAQMRSREKKKFWQTHMENEIAVLRKEKKELWIENQKLKNEILWVKTVLLYHRNCPVAKDPVIKEEINLVVKAAKQDLEKKNAANKNRIQLKKVVPIRPNRPIVIAQTPLSHPVLIQIQNPAAPIPSPTLSSPVSCSSNISKQSPQLVNIPISPQNQQSFLGLNPQVSTSAIASTLTDNSVMQPSNSSQLILAGVKPKLSSSQQNGGKKSNTTATSAQVFTVTSSTNQLFPTLIPTPSITNQTALSPSARGISNMPENSTAQLVPVSTTILSPQHFVPSGKLQTQIININCTFPQIAPTVSPEETNNNFVSVGSTIVPQFTQSTSTRFIEVPTVSFVQNEFTAQNTNFNNNNNVKGCFSFSNSSVPTFVSQDNSTGSHMSKFTTNTNCLVTSPQLFSASSPIKQTEFVAKNIEIANDFYPSLIQKASVTAEVAVTPLDPLKSHIDSKPKKGTKKRYQKREPQKIAKTNI